MKKVLIAIFLTIVFAQLAVSQIQTAKVTGGEVQGVVTEGISIFKGIPFASPPVGDLRWKAPAPVQDWTGIKKADAFGLACMQAAGAMGNTAPVSEDCLYLNVWTPAKKPGEKIPVIVWIYGGGFSGGSTSTPMYDGMGFAKKGVVLVSVAYRVGPFGFPRTSGTQQGERQGIGELWTGGYDRRTEMGEREYCPVWRRSGQRNDFRPLGRRYGGQHAGSFPGHQGTFPPCHLHERRIVCSTPDFESRGNRDGNPGAQAGGVDRRSLSEKTGGGRHQGGPRNERRGDPEKYWGRNGRRGLRFRPVADGYVIPSDLYSIYQARRFNDTPILVGNTSDELGAFGGRGNITAAQFEKQIKSQYGPHADAILSVYPHSTDAEAAKSSKELSRDSMFSWSTWTWARLQSEKGKGKAFEYYYDYHAPNVDGSGHGSDVPYAFQTLSGRTGRSAQTGGFETFRYDQLLLGQLRQNG